LKAFKENSFLDCFAFNPLSKQKIPIYLNSSDDFGELNANGEPYLDARLAIPDLNKTDEKFALENQLEFSRVYDHEKNLIINSDNASNLSRNEAIQIFSDQLKTMAKGGHATSLKLNDWCISRQRKWGTPIPLVFISSGKL
jgi:leucyl-tRNA synthetase